MVSCKVGGRRRNVVHDIFCLAKKTISCSAWYFWGLTCSELTKQVPQLSLIDSCMKLLVEYHFTLGFSWRADIAFCYGLRGVGLSLAQAKGYHQSTHLVFGESKTVECDAVTSLPGECWLWKWLCCNPASSMVRCYAWENPWLCGVQVSTVTSWASESNQRLN